MSADLTRRKAEVRAQRSRDRRRRQRLARLVRGAATGPDVLWVLALLVRESVRAEWAGAVFLVERHRQRRADRAASLTAIEQGRRDELARIVAAAPQWVTWCTENGMPRGAVVWETIATERATA